MNIVIKTNTNFNLISKKDFKRDCWYKSILVPDWYCYASNGIYVIFNNCEIRVINSSSLSDDDVFYQVDEPKTLTLEF